MIKKKATPLIVLTLLLFSFLAACSMEVSKVGDLNPAPTGGLITATLPPTFTPQATATPLPATAIPTVEAVIGKVTARVNVRERPSTVSETVSTIPNNTEIEIIGKDAGEKWYLITFDLASGEGAEGWVSAEYVLTESKPNVPVVAGDDSTGGDEAYNGQITEQVNVRLGPGTDFTTLGILNVGEGVMLRGKNITGTWLQIDFETGNEGKGWVFGAYVESDILDDLPVISESGQEIAQSTQTVMAATAAPTFFPAPDDGDSEDSPAILVTFSTNDARAFSYSSDLSSPEGDAEDWIAFHPTSEEDRVTLLIDLTCEGNGSLYVELWQGGIKLDKWGSLSCGDTDYELSMFRNETYQFRLYAKHSSDLTYISYNLEMSAVP